MTPRCVDALDLEPGDWFFYPSTPEARYLFLAYAKGGWFQAIRYDKAGKAEKPGLYGGNMLKVMYVGKDIPCFGALAVEKTSPAPSSVAEPGVLNASAKSSPILGLVVAGMEVTRRQVTLWFNNNAGIVIKSSPYETYSGFPSHALDVTIKNPDRENNDVYIIQQQRADGWESNYRGTGYSHQDTAFDAARALSKTTRGKVRVYNIMTGNVRAIYNNGWETSE